MNDVDRNHLEETLRETLRQHQREGLNMIGSVDQLLRRLVQAVEDWAEGGRLRNKKGA